MNEGDFWWEERIYPIFDNRVGLTTADFHEGPGAGREMGDRLGYLLNCFGTAIFVYVFHGDIANFSRLKLISTTQNYFPMGACPVGARTHIYFAQPLNFTSTSFEGQ